MRRAAGVVLAAAAVYLVRQIDPGVDEPARATALAFGFTLLAAWTAGGLVRVLRLPRVTGYLLFGMAVGPYLGNIVSPPMAAQLRIVTAIATTLIAVMAGLMLNVGRLGERVQAAARVAAVTLAVTLLGLATVLWIAWPWLPVAPEAHGLTKLAIVFMFVVVASTLSPTMTAAVTSETGARGRMSELVLAIVVIADLCLLLTFSFGLPVVRIAMGGGMYAGSVLLRLAWEAGGAVAFGVFIGAVFALYLRYVGRGVTAALFVTCALLSRLGTTQQFEPLLAALAAGLTIENLAPLQGAALRAAIQRGAAPLLLIFFVSVGTSLRLDLLTGAGAAALLLVAARAVLLRVGFASALSWVPNRYESDRFGWTGLISQAGITIGFAATLASEFPEWGGRIQTVLIAMLAVDELLGPLLFRYGLARAQELDPVADASLIVASNREPYLHQYTGDGDIVSRPAAGGVAVALDALMRRRGGVWIAHGAGDADRAVVDEHDVVRVPPAAPTYRLRRLWIDEPTFAAYYGGFANQGLWPLCHQVDVRPTFHAAEWTAYQEVNEQFAAAIDDEMGESTAPVFIQDYHLALVAPALRGRRDGVRTALFWHIPWPHPDRLRICPWHVPLLRGLLANDLLAFQVDHDRRNFLAGVERYLGGDVHEETSEVTLDGRRTTVAAVPIGVDFDRIQRIAADSAIHDEQRHLTQLFGLDGRVVGIGVDRLDYTKGIPERLAAIDALLSRQPTLRGRFTFVQIGVPSRSELQDYIAVERVIGRRVQEINARHRVPCGGPAVVFHRAALRLDSLVALYRLADLCIVSSLHDGMNLVAKEFVAARDDDDGVLVLSELAGAAHELTDALVINPYDVEGFADALEQALIMDRTERRTRMRAMRQIVAGRDVFLWASDILHGLDALSASPLQERVRHWQEMAV